MPIRSFDLGSGIDRGSQYFSNYVELSIAQTNDEAAGDAGKLEPHSGKSLGATSVERGIVVYELLVTA